MEQKPKTEMISPTGMILIVLGVTYAVLLLADLWGDIFSYDTLWKVSVTYGVVAVVVVGVYLIRREFIDGKKLKDDKYID